MINEEITDCCIMLPNGRGKGIQLISNSKIYNSLYKIIAGRQEHQVAAYPDSAHSAASLYEIDLSSVYLELRMRCAESDIKTIQSAKYIFTDIIHNTLFKKCGFEVSGFDVMRITCSKLSGN